MRQKRSDKGYLEKIEDLHNHSQILLPQDEYAMIISELNTNMSEADRSRKYVTKPIGNYYYTVINRGFDDYTIIRKVPILDEENEHWEAIQ